MNLPYDIARCQGSGNDITGWRDGCENCLRRTADVPKDRPVQFMDPPKLIVFECPSLILKRKMK